MVIIPSVIPVITVLTGMATDIMITIMATADIMVTGGFITGTQQVTAIYPTGQDIPLDHLLQALQALEKQVWIAEVGAGLIRQHMTQSAPALPPEEQ